MTDTNREASDPARDLLRAISILESVGKSNSTVADRIGIATKTTPWKGEFFHALKLLLDSVDEMHSILSSQEGLDERDLKDLDSDVGRLRSVFQHGYLTGNLDGAVKQGQPLGPETRTFLQGASRQIRTSRNYFQPSDEDISVIRNAIEVIRTDLKDVRLEGVDFARDALLRGCNEVSFIIERIDMFGFSRLEGPTMELGAFLFTISAELQGQAGNTTAIVKSMSALSNAYAKMKELSKGYGVAKMVYDGAHWLITHLSK